MSSGSSFKFDVWSTFGGGGQSAYDALSGGAYPDLVADPAGTAHHVSAAVGLPTDDGLTGEIAAFLESQRSGGRAAPPPELPTMGYIHDAVLSDPVVSAYCRRFGVQPERSRLTGVHSPA